MSIYATLWALRFPRFGQYYVDCDWVTVVAQGVPGYVGGEGADPYESFLPPLSTSVAGGLRAVVFVEPASPKGTSGCAQEYRRRCSYSRVSSTHRRHLLRCTRDSVMH